MWVLLFLAGSLGFIVAIGALLWSFIKKNKDLRKKSLIGGLLAMIMFFTGVIISPTDDSDSSVETPKTEQTSKTSSTSKKEEKNSTKQSKKKTSATSSSKKKSTKTSSSSKKEIKSSSETVSSSSSTETSSSAKKYDDAANTAFASELSSQLNAALSQNGVTDSIAVMPNGSGVIDAVVPQDYKYLPNSQIQQLADVILSAKNNIFLDWNAKPENSYDKASAPILYVKSPDGATLAKESVWSGSMKRVIDNN